MFIFNTPQHRCADPVLDYFQEETKASWEDMLPWIPRQRGYPRWIAGIFFSLLIYNISVSPSQCLMVDSQSQSSMFMNQTQTYFNNLKLQESNPDRFTGIRRTVLSFVESAAHKNCDSGWKYDHSLVFNTISSEVCYTLFAIIIITNLFVHFIIINIFS